MVQWLAHLTCNPGNKRIKGLRRKRKGAGDIHRLKGAQNRDVKASGLGSAGRQIVAQR